MPSARRRRYLFVESFPSPASKIPSTYKAFAYLPNRGRYQSIADIEARLSFDDASLLALCAACRQEREGAWNLLLLALGRRLRRYLTARQPEELGALLGWLVEAIREEAHPSFYLWRAVGHARRSRKTGIAREEEHVQVQIDSGAAQLAHDGEERALASWSPTSDPLLRKRLTAALDKLTKSQRQIFLLDAEGYAGAEIAELLEVSEGGVRVRLAEARRILRNVLGDVWDLR